jgi:TonB family protein
MVIEMVAEAEVRDRRLFRWSLLAALLFHLFLFAVHWPSFAGTEPIVRATPKPRLYVVQPIRFKPAPAVRREAARPVARRIPLPDPTPNEPEPVRDLQPVVVEQTLDLLSDAGLALGVPGPPPAEGEGAVRFSAGGPVSEPIRIGGPNPLYPEEARRARLQGAVVLECLIGKEGSVRDIKVLRGLPSGLTEAAVDAVRQWLFKPSMLDGKPVDVIYILTVRFNLQ